MTEIEYLESKIREEQDEVARLRREEHNGEYAERLYAIYKSFVDAGFNEDEAFTLFLTLIKVVKTD